MSANISILDLVSRAWSAFKANPWPLFLSWLVLMAISFVFSICGNVVSSGATSMDSDLVLLGALVSVGLQLVGTLVGIYLSIGMLRIALATWRGQPTQLSVLFEGGRVLTYLGAYFLFGLAVLIGMLACFLPGLYIMVALWPVLFVVVDQEQLGAIDSLREAKRLTEGNILSSIVLFLMIFALQCAGIVTCCVGLLVAGPIVVVLQAGFYDTLKEAKGGKIPALT